MYGFNTRLADDVERFRFLRSLPGAYVFVQEYQPIPGGPPPSRADFFDERADELIDQLVRIMFPLEHEEHGEILSLGQQTVRTDLRQAPHGAC